MKTKITIGVALLAVAAMLFAGIAAGERSSATRSASNSAALDNSRAQDGYSGLIVTGIWSVGDESVRVANLGDNPINLNGFTLRTEKGTTFSLPDAVVNPKEELTISFGNGIPSSRTVFLNSRDKDVVDDLADTITLIDPSGKPVSVIAFASITDDFVTDDKTSVDYARTGASYASAPSGLSALTSTFSYYGISAGVTQPDGAAPAGLTDFTVTADASSTLTSATGSSFSNSDGAAPAIDGAAPATDGAAPATAGTSSSTF